MPKIHSFLAVLPRFLMALRLGDNADVFSFSAAISACEKCGHWPLGRLAALWRNWVLFSNESNNPAENYWIYSFWGPCWNFLRSGNFFWFTEKLSVMLCSNLDVFSFASAHGQVFRRCPHKLSAAALADVSPTEIAWLNLNLHHSQYSIEGMNVSEQFLGRYWIFRVLTVLTV